MKKKSLFVLGGIVTATTALYCYAGHYFYNYAINTKTNKEGIMGKSDLEKQRKRQEAFSSYPYQETTIQSFDGLHLYGSYYLGNKHTWMIMVHGYSGSHIDMANLGQAFHQRGYSVLMIDQRGHGKSEGEACGMGYLESYDLVHWIKFILDQDKDAHIFLYGVSMGAASVMMTTGLELPCQVKGCIEDCGFTSAIELFKYQLKQRYPIPMNWVITASNLYTKKRAHYFFEQANALKALSNSITPTLFIHGTKDDFVPYPMVHRLYEACHSPKDIYLVEGVNHAESYRHNPQKYIDVMIEFMNKYDVDE